MTEWLSSGENRRGPRKEKNVAQGGGKPSGTVGGKPTTATSKPVALKKGEIHFILTDDEIRKAEDCLRRSGNIKFTFEEITVTHLPTTLDNGRLID
jgi:hypothetical protein